MRDRPGASVLADEEELARLYAAFRVTRTYLPCWRELVDAEREAFRSRVRQMETLLGSVHTRRRFIAAQNSSNQCLEIML